MSFVIGPVECARDTSPSWKRGVDSDARESCARSSDVARCIDFRIPHSKRVMTGISAVQTENVLGWSRAMNASRKSFPRFIVNTHPLFKSCLSEGPLVSPWIHIISHASTFLFHLPIAQQTIAILRFHDFVLRLFATYFRAICWRRSAKLPISCRRAAPAFLKSLCLTIFFIKFVPSHCAERAKIREKNRFF